MIEVLDHVYVFYAYQLYFADKDIYMIRYCCYHKIEIMRLLLYSNFALEAENSITSLPIQEQDYIRYQVENFF